MKAYTGDKDNIHYFDKKTKTTKSRYDNIPHNFEHIPRANNPAKSLSHNAKLLVVRYSNILKNKDDIVFRKHKFISSITKVKNHQNNNIHKELSKIFHIKYHRSVIINGVKHREGFSIQKTENAEEILRNPSQFFAKSDENKLRKTSQLSERKFTLNCEKSHAHSLYIINNILNYSKEREEEHLCDSSSLSDDTNTDNRLVMRARAEGEFGGEKIEDEGGSGREGVLGTSFGSGEEGWRRRAAVEQALATGSLGEPAKADDGVVSARGAVEETTEEQSEVTQGKAELLSAAIIESFGEVRGREIINNCEFAFRRPLQLHIDIQGGVVLEGGEKAILRAQIGLIYGDNIRITANAIKSSKIAKNTSANVLAKRASTKPASDSYTVSSIALPVPMTLPEVAWEKFKTVFAEKMNCQYVLKDWFSKFEIAQKSTETELVLKGPSFNVESIKQRFYKEMIDTVVATGIEIEMYFDGCCYGERLIITHETVAQYNIRRRWYELN